MPPNPAQPQTRAPVTDGHIKLLQRFGKNQAQRDLSDEDRDKFWLITCRMANLPPVPRAMVVDAWRKLVSGQSDRTALAIATDVEPQFVSIGITYDRRLYAGHTLSTKTVVKKILKIYARCFTSRDDFMTEMQIASDTAWNEREK